MRKLLVLLFLVNILFATSQNEIFLKKIKRENSLLIDIKTLDNVEQNIFQRALKEKMDKLIGYYLKSDDLFSKEALAVTKKNNHSALEYRDFFERLFVYLSYLEKHNNKKENRKMLDTLLHKALKDSTMLMRNSDNFLDYMLSLNMIKKIYSSINNLENYKEIFVKYPIPKSELFFEKLELDKQKTLNIWKETEQQGFIGVSKESMQKIKDEVTRKFIPILDTYYAKIKKAILDGSEKSIKEYEEYVLSVEKIDNPLWEHTKFKLSIYKVKVFDMLGIKNSSFGNIPDIMAIVLLKMTKPYLIPYRDAYKEHRALEQKQRELFEY